MNLLYQICLDFLTLSVHASEKKNHSHQSVFIEPITRFFRVLQKLSDFFSDPTLIVKRGYKLKVHGCSISGGGGGGGGPFAHQHSSSIVFLHPPALEEL